MSDLVKRLQDPPFGTDTSERLLMKSAADHIEALEAALAKADALASCVTALDNPANEEQANEIYGAMLTAVAAYHEPRKKLQGKEATND